MFQDFVDKSIESSLTRSYAAFLGAQPTSANLQQTGLYHRYFPARFVKFNTATFHRTHISRSSHWKCSVKKGIFKNFEKFTGKKLCQSLFFNKVAGVLCYRTRLDDCFRRVNSSNAATDK